ncbi:hypothetical protein ELE36_07185 [Pseudolysobacter antarcticus]|uniref:Uncharacterized protein n=1 Tax=Pseudolysobacter antarcticus TaxID=2511995 RepID=A0A411HI26_9GAMM|nr:hypothetical protein [Pseudolysobacter antarcticus]QBB70165.1 hypothetical protein ELE36_07185 [Pseudolysobacter antarcticus]
MKKSILRHALTLALLAPSCLFAAFPDHEKFDATLHVPYRGTASEARDFTLRFSYPGQGAGIAAAWRLDVRNEAGNLVRTFCIETLPIMQIERAATPGSAHKEDVRFSAPNVRMYSS